MTVTLFGMVIEVRFIQSLNASSSIVVTPSGIVTDVAFFSQRCRVSLCITSLLVFEEFAIKAPQLTELFLELLLIKLSNTQPEKAFFPIDKTLLGRVIEVRAAQSSKACSPIVFTLLGMVIEVRAFQEIKAFFPMVFTLFGMVTEESVLQ